MEQTETTEPTFCPIDTILGFSAFHKSKSVRFPCSLNPECKLQPPSSKFSPKSAIIKVWNLSLVTRSSCTHSSSSVVTSAVSLTECVCLLFTAIAPFFSWWSRGMMRSKITLFRTPAIATPGALSDAMVPCVPTIHRYTHNIQYYIWSCWNGLTVALIGCWWRLIFADGVGDI